MSAFRDIGIGLLGGLSEGVADVGEAKLKTKEALEVADKSAAIEAMHQQGLERLRHSNNMAQIGEEGRVRGANDLAQIDARREADLEINAANNRDRTQGDLAVERLRGANDVNVETLRARSTSRSGMVDVDDEGYSHQEIKRKDIGGLEETIKIRYKGDDVQRLDPELGWVRLNPEEIQAERDAAAAEEDRRKNEPGPWEKFKGYVSQAATPPAQGAGYQGAGGTGTVDQSGNTQTQQPTPKELPKGLTGEAANKEISEAMADNPGVSREKVEAALRARGVIK